MERKKHGYCCFGDGQYNIMIIPKDKSPHSFSCHKCAKDRASFFVAPIAAAAAAAAAAAGSVQHKTDIIPLCFQCYVLKKKWKWRIVKP